jgi:esterase/lipase
MPRPILPIILAAFALAQPVAASAGNFYYEIDPSKCAGDQSSSCIQKLVESNLKGVPKLQPQKTKFGFVFLHGLWGGRDQFRDWAKDLTKSGNNTFLVALPGHDEDRKNFRANRHDWKKEVEATVRLAKLTSEKVVIVGQSTGGILGLQQALEHPDTVDGLILVEPAFLVKSLPLMGVCLGGLFVKETKDLEPLPSKLGYETVEGQYLKFGCEVDAIRRDLVSKFVKTNEQKCHEAFQATPMDSEFNNVYTDLESLFKKVRTPAALVLNTEDNVVSNAAIRLFQEARPKNTELTVISRKTRHGDSTSLGIRTCQSAASFMLTHFKSDAGFMCQPYLFSDELDKKAYFEVARTLNEAIQRKEQRSLLQVDMASSPAEFRKNLYFLGKEVLGGIKMLALHSCGADTDESHCLSSSQLGRKILQLTAQGEDVTRAVFKDYIEHHPAIPFTKSFLNGKESYETDGIPDRASFDIAFDEYIGREKDRIFKLGNDLSEEIGKLLNDEKLKQLLESAKKEFEPQSN